MPTLYPGKHLHLMSTPSGWEYAQRPSATSVVAILAITPQNEILLVEQPRPPINRNAIELPAGLVGDTDSAEHELAAVHRELLEETGHTCAAATLLATGPSSAGLTSETISLYHAHSLTRVCHPQGDGHEQITLHTIPLATLHPFLSTQSAQGKAIDLKIYAALHLARIPTP